MFNNLFSSTGRIGRLEYGISVVLYFTAVTIVRVICENNNGLIGLFHIPLLWFLFAQGAKRCHDVNNSGWYQIIPFYFLWMVFQEGTTGLNDYGYKTENQEQPLTPKPHVNRYSIDNTVYHNPKPQLQHNVPLANVVQSLQQQRPVSNQQTVLEVANVNYALTQDVLKKLRLLDKANGLSYTLNGTTASITINHNNTSRSLLDDLYRIMPNIDVYDIKSGSISIKIK